LPDRPFRCSDASLRRDEPLYGTASHVLRWLLLEQPGSWGPNAIPDSRLPTRIGAELRARAASAGVRIVLLRRGPRLSEGKRHCYLARTDGHDDYLSELKLDHVGDILDVDLSPLRRGGPIEGATDREEPLFLVCTHGRHDACCSIRGNHVSRVACAAAGSDAWECSHIGGDRFAANLVCFPQGVYYGRVTPSEVAGVMQRFREGTLSLEHYRGRCAYPFHIQAAEYFVRARTGELGLDDVSFVDAAGTADGATVTFGLAGGRRAVVEIEVSAGPERHRLTCGSPDERPIPHYELVSLDLQDP
jgi:hypothetical protein